MSLRVARWYRRLSRIAFPLLVLWNLGTSGGFLLFEWTGHLGLFSGPLGQFRKELLSGTDGSLPMPSERPVALFWLLVWLGFLVTELRHLRFRSLRRPQMLLTCGYSLGALLAAARTLVPYTQESSLLSTALLVSVPATATMLTLGAWPSWGRRARLAAPFTCIAGLLLTLLALRAHDRTLLRRGLAPSSDARPSLESPAGLLRRPIEDNWCWADVRYVRANQEPVGGRIGRSC